MGAIISGQHEAYYSCDWHEGCDSVSEKHHFTDNIVEIDELVRHEGWYVNMSKDEAFCPEHSPYNRHS